MVDRHEQQRRGQSLRKTSTKHPYAAVEHRIIDSPAFASLRPSSQVLLLLLARQHTGKNNGHLQATHSWCSRYGFGSEHTLRGAIAELIAHGFVFRTRSHGANGAWARYALTWLPITDKDGLFLAGFSPNAWRDWNMSNGKSTRQKLLDHSGRKCSFTPEHPAETAGSRGAKTADYELCCHSSSEKPPLDNENSISQIIAPKEENSGRAILKRRGASKPCSQRLGKHGKWIESYFRRLDDRGGQIFALARSRCLRAEPGALNTLH